MCDKISSDLRILLATWCSIIVMMSTAVAVYDVRFSGLDAGIVMIAIGMASLVIGLSTGTVVGKQNTK